VDYTGIRCNAYQAGINGSPDVVLIERDIDSAASSSAAAQSNDPLAPPGLIPDICTLLIIKVA
jgi:hypothetical protein